MAISQLALHSQEWKILHQDHEYYDRYALLIKLVAVIICLLSTGLSLNFFLGTVLIPILWLQEGIWRTAQARIGERLLIVEKLIERLAKHPHEQAAMQLYSNWEAARPGTTGLIKEYLRNALRPTIAYPYVILLVIEIIALLFFS